MTKSRMEHMLPLMTKLIPLLEIVSKRFFLATSQLSNNYFLACFCWLHLIEKENCIVNSLCIAADI